MAILSKNIICLGTALLAAQGVLAAPTTRSSDCDFGIANPSEWPSTYQSQWCSMITNEVTALKTSENPKTMLSTLKAIFTQARIKVSPDSALANVDKIMQDPQARAAMTQMKANFPAFGSMDLTAEDIQKVYGDAIKAACKKTGVPEDIMVKIIWTESKGHPLVYNGLTQMDYVAWGQMADENPELKNRYMPTDNIVAAAMFLQKAKAKYGGDWETTYTQHYQDPTAASRSS
ncbi:uncharacterized protein MYCFIDRAFT_212292 [Pseudocercospora fijiensis CIRAD86]|uniref:Transglycosylase SLT domain-containing protein n=1 Tax=Pseudocercospora fijiensis (strain CIRAD86) TaxID=383855 RepID=M3AQL5_PSEFD|nr:uncharacterized protein MYCFIDRAFT_212292 [Pseudocercospora fijiensis CIRAD86]EME79712.1 hypothetical protein MYCFIDRAFT_212292 [Pseudocercospora fijiensis CIRAD86]